MNKTDLIIKHLNALVSKYQLEIDLLTEMKKKPTNELHQAEIDINIKYFEEEIKEIKEIINSLEQLPVYIDYSEGKSFLIAPSGEGRPLSFLASFQQELIKDAEEILKAFKEANSEEEKFQIVQREREIFFDKFYDSFPDFCFIFGRTLDFFYTIEVSEKYIEFLKALDYREAEKEMLIWSNENLKNLKN